MKADATEEEDICYSITGNNPAHDSKIIDDYFKESSELELTQAEDVLIKHLVSSLKEMDCLSENTAFFHGQWLTNQLSNVGTIPNHINLLIRTDDEEKFQLICEHIYESVQSKIDPYAKNSEELFFVNKINNEPFIILNPNATY